MDDARVVRIVQGQQKLICELPHQQIWRHLILKHGPVRIQRLAHELKHEAYMYAVRALHLEVIDEVTNKLVPRVRPVFFAEMSEDLSLVDRPRLVIALCGENLESSEFAFIAFPALR